MKTPLNPVNLGVPALWVGARDACKIAWKSGKKYDSCDGHFMMVLYSLTIGAEFVVELLSDLKANKTPFPCQESLHPKYKTCIIYNVYPICSCPLAFTKHFHLRVKYQV